MRFRKILVTILGGAAALAAGNCGSTETTCEDLAKEPGCFDEKGGSSGSSGSAGASGEAGDGTGGTGGTPAGGSATGGASGGTAGSAGDAGAGQGGGSEPCNGECEPPTPICLEATETCVECTERSHCEAPRPACDTDGHVCVECLASTDCDDPTPVCDMDAQECVGCLDNMDCDDPTPVCDTDAQECVECLESGDCTKATASRCASTNTCAACMNSADCAHIPGKNVCDGGTCVQCTVANETACGANSCNPATKACTTTPRGSVGICQPCLADSECTGSIQADPDARCAPMEFQGAQRPAGFCLRRAAKVCNRPFMTLISASSLSGAAVEDYCGIAQSVTRCEAVLDFVASRSCPEGNASECGCARDGNGACTESGQGGLCETVGASARQCTYPCANTNNCPSGAACVVGLQYCNTL